MSRVFLVVAASTIGMWGCQPTPLCPDVYSDVAVSVPAFTYAPVVSRFAPITAATAPGATGTTVSIVSNQGTVSYAGRGPFQAFIYNSLYYAIVDRTLYGGLGVENGTWFPFWLFCSADGRLTKIQGEMTDRAVAIFEDLEGTCTDQGVASMDPVSLAANTLSPVALTCGFSVHGPAPASIDLESSRNGSMVFFGNDSIALPFYTNDCRMGCGTPGWYELHLIVWDQIRQLVGFEIIYLDDRGVHSGNEIALPDGSTGNMGTFQGATWSLSR
jgi:hypothetical protein